MIWSRSRPVDVPSPGRGARSVGGGPCRPRRGPWGVSADHPPGAGKADTLFSLREDDDLAETSPNWAPATPTLMRSSRYASFLKPSGRRH